MTTVIRASTTTAKGTECRSHLRAVGGRFTADVPAVVATAGEWLDRAAALAGQLSEALHHAQLAVSGLAAAGTADPQ